MIKRLPTWKKISWNWNLFLAAFLNWFTDKYSKDDNFEILKNGNYYLPSSAVRCLCLQKERMLMYELKFILTVVLS
jgi:hypothetical protein